MALRFCLLDQPNPLLIGGVCIMKEIEVGEGNIAVLPIGAPAFPIPDTALAAHTAVLGKTGSGKTSTAKLIVEHVVAEGDRVCILDPIKSDWWGITSSADGKKPGLPFTILGGPRGSVGLPASSGKALGQLIGSGKLPLSILDMVDFEAGDLQRFFSDFAGALMRNMRGVLYLVVEEAHEFAPKERGGFGNENQSIHWAKKLATAGRSKGIRLIVATQRVQALHNAVLGSCETLIAHRLTTPADQDPVLKWMGANTDKEAQGQVGASISSLPTGTGWVCSGEAQLFDRIAFPRFQTFDNTATPDRESGERTVVTAPVDEEGLRAILGAAVDDAKASDPKALKAEVARLTRELSKVQRAVAAPPAPERVVANADEIAAARAEGVRVGYAHGIAAAQQALAALGGGKVSFTPAKARAAAPVPPAVFSGPVVTAAGVTASQQKILNALAWWKAFGIDRPTNEQVGFVAGYSPGSGNFNNLKGQLRAAGAVDYPAPGMISLTDEGEAKAQTPPIDVTREAFHTQVRAKLSSSQLRLFDPILAAYPDAITAQQVADEAGYSAGSGNFNNLRGQLRTIGLIDYPQTGMVRAADWLFP